MRRVAAEHTTLERQGYRIPEVAQIVGCGRTKIYDLIREGTVDPFVKTPRRFILAAEIRLDPRLRGSVSAPPRYPSPQPYLWSLDDLEWHTVMPLPPYRARPATRVADEQARLFP